MTWIGRGQALAFRPTRVRLLSVDRMDFLEECPARRIRLRNQTRKPKKINMVSVLGRRNKVKMACHNYAELGYFARNAYKQGRYSLHAFFVLMFAIRALLQ